MPLFQDMLHSTKTTTFFVCVGFFRYLSNVAIAAG